MDANPDRRPPLMQPPYAGMQRRERTMISKPISGSGYTLLRASHAREAVGGYGQSLQERDMNTQSSPSSPNLRHFAHLSSRSCINDPRALRLRTAQAIQPAVEPLQRGGVFLHALAAVSRCAQNGISQWGQQQSSNPESFNPISQRKTSNSFTIPNCPIINR